MPSKKKLRRQRNEWREQAFRQHSASERLHDLLTREHDTNTRLEQELNLLRETAGRLFDTLETIATNPDAVLAAAGDLMALIYGDQGKVNEALAQALEYPQRFTWIDEPSAA